LAVVFVGANSALVDVFVGGNSLPHEFSLEQEKWRVTKTSPIQKSE